MTEEFRNTSPVVATVSSDASPTRESDRAFIDRQFERSIEALERIGALAPGEFEHLMQLPAGTDAERDCRATLHRDIARRILVAMRDQQLREEDFNLWTGRRRENGQPIKVRFEEAYARCHDAAISRKRGTLTGIIRAYQHLLDTRLQMLEEAAISANSTEDLFELERQAAHDGLLDFEKYVGGNIAGWPIFMRSNGIFRGATRLREVFDRRQEQLPMTPEQAAAVLFALCDNVPEPAPEIPVASADTLSAPAPLRRFMDAVTRLFEK